jgi:two-component system sensor histidine kinase DesK
MVASLGEVGMSCAVYLAVATVMVLPLPVAGPIVVILIVGSLALSAVEGWGSQIGLAFAIMAASVAVLGMRTVLRRNQDLLRAEQENASLAVENERTRFARDLHDILGHSLTVITVKAELAQRLLDVDLDRARAELVDLERLSRDALTDVRRAVEGYRELTLPGELTRARNALAAAEIEARLPNSADDVPTELRELFAWTVREGVTNVIRHSGARSCEVRLTPTSAEVLDDGDGAASAPGSGSGLAGLRERAATVDATVVVRHLSPGYSLAVVRS